MCLLGWDSRGRPIFGRHLRRTRLADRFFMFPAYFNSKDRPSFDPSYRVSEDWSLYRADCRPTYGSGYGGGRWPNRRPIRRRPWALKSLSVDRAILTVQDEGDDGEGDDQGEDPGEYEWLMVQAEDGDQRFWASSELRDEVQSKMEELKHELKLHLGFDVDGQDPRWSCARDRFKAILDKLDTLDHKLNNYD